MLRAFFGAIWVARRNPAFRPQFGWIFRDLCIAQGECICWAAQQTVPDSARQRQTVPDNSNKQQRPLKSLPPPAKSTQIPQGCRNSANTPKLATCQVARLAQTEGLRIGSLTMPSSCKQFSTVHTLLALETIEEQHELILPCLFQW